MSTEVFKVPRAKRPHPKRTTESFSPPIKRHKSREKFLNFCDIVLSYTQYEHIKQQELRSQNTSPLDSGGSAAESYTSESAGLSIDEYGSPHSNSSYGSSGHNDSIINPTRTSETGLSDEESGELVTCFCRKPFGGRPMIECSCCLTWVHLSCAKIRKTNIPEEFTCQLCREAKSKKRKSGRKRFEKKMKDV